MKPKVTDESPKGGADQDEQEKGKDQDQGPEGKDKDEGQGGAETPEEDPQGKPADKKYPLDVAGLGAGCQLPEKCATNTWLVDFEELGDDTVGYQVMPAKVNDPDGTTSMLNPPNKVSPFSLRNATDGSQDQEMVITCEGKTCVVGRVQPSTFNPSMTELLSGPLLDSLRALLQEFLKNKRKGGGAGRVERIHFF